MQPKTQTTYVDEIEAQFRTLVAETLGCELSKVTDKADFTNTLNADSIDIIELLIATEEDFGIVIEDEEAEKVETVDDAIRLIRRKSK